MRPRLTLMVLLVSTLLGACGTRGPLTLPPQQSKAKASANDVLPPAKYASTLTDLNMAKVLS